MGCRLGRRADGRGDLGLEGNEEREGGSAAPSRALAFSISLFSAAARDDEALGSELLERRAAVSYTHLTLPTTPYV